MLSFFLRFVLSFIVFSFCVLCGHVFLDAEGKTAASMPVSNTETRDKSMSEANLK